MQNYSETSGIHATAAVYHRSDIITKEPLRLVNSMKCDKSNLIRKKLAFFFHFCMDTITEGSSPLSIYALGIFLDLHVKKGCFKPKSFKKQVNICEIVYVDCDWRGTRRFSHIALKETASSSTKTTPAVKCTWSVNYCYPPSPPPNTHTHTPPPIPQLVHRYG